MSPLLERFLAHALPIGMRLGGIMTFAPFFGSDALNIRVKAAFVIALTAMLYGVCPVPDLPLTVYKRHSRWSSAEAVMGLMMGLSVQIVLEGAQVAGQLAGAQLGFSLAAIIDPQTNIETPVLTIFFQMIALLIFLQLDVHHWILRALVKSFSLLSCGRGRTLTSLPRAISTLRRGHVADRRTDRRADFAGHLAHRRNRRISQQGFPAIAGHVHRYLGEEHGRICPAGCVRGALARFAGTQIFLRMGWMEHISGVGALSRRYGRQPIRTSNRTSQQRRAKKGQVVRSRDLASALTLLAVDFGSPGSHWTWIGRWRGLFERLLRRWRGVIGYPARPFSTWTLLTVAQWVGARFDFGFGRRAC